MKRAALVAFLLCFAVGAHASFSAHVSTQGDSTPDEPAISSITGTGHWISTAYEPPTRLVWTSSNTADVFALSWKDGTCRFEGKNIDDAARRFFQLLVKGYMQPELDRVADAHHTRPDWTEWRVGWQEQETDPGNFGWTPHTKTFTAEKDALTLVKALRLSQQGGFRVRHVTCKRIEAFFQ